MIELAALLRAAAAAHHDYEQAHGEDSDWPTWYARYMAPRLGLAIPMDYQPCEGTYGKA